MEDRECHVTIGEETRIYEAGTTYQRIAEDFQKDYPHQIVLAFVDGHRLQELRKRVKNDCSIRFVTTADKIGHETYRRSLCFLLVKAVHDVGGHENVQRVRIHFSVDKGYYCTVDGNVRIDRRFLIEVEARMRELSDQRVPIGKRSVHTDEAVELFHRHGMYDKEKLFLYRRVSKVNIYNINEFEDY